MIAARASRSGRGHRVSRRQQLSEDLDAGLLDRPEVAAVEGRLKVAIEERRRRIDDLIEAEAEQPIILDDLPDGVDAVQFRKRMHCPSPDLVVREPVVHAYHLLPELKAHR